MILEIPDKHIFLNAESGDPLMLAPEIRARRESTVPWEESYFIWGLLDSGRVSVVGARLAFRLKWIQRKSLMNG